MSTKEIGNKGEDLACEYLVKKGYKILERNCVLFCGEIDIIARKKGGLKDFFKRINPLTGSGRVIHFVEVKALSAENNFYPEEHVNFRKQRKLRQLAEIWLQKQKYPQNTPCQIDIIAVSTGAGHTQIEYFENVVEDK